MKRNSLPFAGLLALGLLLVAVPPSWAGSSEASDEASPVRVLVGEYKWNHQDRPGPLRAEFTATGVDRWDVAFHFRFDGRDRTYLGTAEGTLTEGRLEGKVFNENRRRTFIFDARFEDGRLQGTHAETTSGGATRTGTLSLAEESSGS